MHFYVILYLYYWHFIHSWNETYVWHVHDSSVQDGFTSLS